MSFTLIEYEQYTEASAYGDVETCHTIAAHQHNVTVVEHGARASILFADCSCGWHAGPHRWPTIQAKAEAHTAKYRKSTLDTTSETE